jgi:hypothetical protein
MVPKKSGGERRCRARDRSMEKELDHEGHLEGSIQNTHLYPVGRAGAYWYADLKSSHIYLSYHLTIP